MSELWKKPVLGEWTGWDENTRSRCDTETGEPFLTIIYDGGGSWDVLYVPAYGRGVIRKWMGYESLTLEENMRRMTDEFWASLPEYNPPPKQ